MIHGSYELCSCALVFMEQRFFASLTPCLPGVGFRLKVTSRMKESCLLQIVFVAHILLRRSHVTNEWVVSRANEWDTHKAHTYTHNNSHIHAHHTHTLSHTYTCTHMHIHIHTHIHTLSHTNTHTHTLTLMNFKTCVRKLNPIKKKSRHVWSSHVACEWVMSPVLAHHIL